MQTTLTKTELRSKLGDFSSIICLQAMIDGMEEALGEKATAIALMTSGRKRGKNLIKSLGLSGSSAPLEEITAKMAAALGENGTRLCLIHRIANEDGIIKAYITEDVCTSGKPQGDDQKCLFTLGAVWGALEEIFGQRFQGQHTESVLKGASYNVFEFKALT
jgi:predicted hydrocarbon binding protein